MAKVTSHIGKERYKIEVTSPSGNTLISDEPVSDGGQNKGVSPTELLAASLAACTSVTLRMYADRKGWDLTEMTIDIDLSFLSNIKGPVLPPALFYLFSGPRSHPLFGAGRGVATYFSITK